MPTINLRKYYPFPNEDCFVEVSDEVAEALLRAHRQVNNYCHRVWYHKAYYSLDYGEVVENSILQREPSPEEILMQKVSMGQLCEAFHHLSPIQARRVYAFYILGMKNVEIARAEGVTGSVISSSIKRALKNLRSYFDKKKWTE